MLNKSLLTGLCIAGMLCIGCNNEPKYGKYSEEQMQQIGRPDERVLPEPTGNSMVIGIHSETISSDDILSASENNLRPAAPRMTKADFFAEARPFVQELIRAKITDILLYQQARKSAPDTIDDILKKAVDDRVTRFVASYGNDYALAEAKIKEMGMDWRSFREYQKKLIMTDSYLSSAFKEEKRFSQRQLRDYYEQNKEKLFSLKGEMIFRVIDIQPALLTTDQLKGQSPQAAAVGIAEELIAQLNDGADFAQLAKRYHGNMAAGGGMIIGHAAGDDELPEPYNSLETAAAQMQIGQIQGPIEIDGHLFILRLDALQAARCQSFNEALPLIEQRLLFQHNRQQYTDLIGKLVKNSDLAEVDHFTDFCVNQAYSRWKGA